MSSSANFEGDAEPAVEADEPGSGEASKDKSALLAELLDSGDAVASARAPAPELAIAGPLGTRIGHFVEWAPGAAPTVDYPGNERGPLPARSVIPLDRELVAEAIEDARGVMLSFEDGRPEEPIITGILQPLEQLGAEAELQDAQDEDASVDLEVGAGAIADLDARVDGRRVEIEAADEIVLRCGKASIVLRRNGRVVIRGTYVETRSRGVNRIKGGSVEIN